MPSSDINIKQPKKKKINFSRFSRAFLDNHLRNIVRNLIWEALRFIERLETEYFNSFY